MKKISSFLIIFTALVIPLPLASQSSPLVVINEIMIGGTDDAKNEFIELYNPTENSIDLTKYKLKKKTKGGAESNLVSSSKFTGVIPGYGYFLIAHPDYAEILNADLVYSGASYSISSNNTVLLYDSEDNLLDKVGYGEASDFEGQAAPESEKNQSIERKPAGQDTHNNKADFVIKGVPTPQNSGGQKVEIEQEPEGKEEQKEQEEKEISSGTDTNSVPANKAPLAKAGPDVSALTEQEIVFDASDSSDPDNDSLSYFWNFGDGQTSPEKKTTHTYSFPGQYIVSLKVSDGQLSNTDIAIINIYSSSISISEFMPDPEGSDNENEWIELYNASEDIANLSAWRLDDAEEGSNPFVFPDNTFIAPKSFLVISKVASKLSLNNDSDSVRLFYPDGSLSLQVNYSSGRPREGESVVFDGNSYYWSSQPTPGAPNIIQAKNKQKDKENQSLLPGTTEQSREPEDNSQYVNLEHSQQFSTLNPEANPTGQLPEEDSYNPDQVQQTDSKLAAESQTESNQTSEYEQTLSLSQKSGKSKLILMLCSVASASLLLAWGLNLMRSKLVE